MKKLLKMHYPKISYVNLKLRDFRLFMHNQIMNFNKYYLKQGVYRTLKTLKNPEISGGDPENPVSPEKPSFHVVKTLKIVFFPIKKITGLKKYVSLSIPNN